MSERTEQVAEAVESVSDVEALRRWYHVPVLAALFSFMLWVRAKNWQAYVVDGEVLFAGNDPWYHYRMVEYTVRHWPFTMPFDVWTSFPTGTRVGQFGTLYDQLIATAALVVGLGSPSEHTVRMVHLFAPAVFGAATVVPVYYLGKRLAGRLGGLTGALLIALTPGELLTRSVAGFTDHHVAEAFFHAVAFVLVLVALDVAQRELPVWELFESRDWDALKPTLWWSAAAGVGIALYLWTWPPGVFLLGILALGLAVAMSAHYVRGLSPDHVAISGATMMLVTAALMLVRVRNLDLSAADFTLVHPVLAVLVALGCAFMAWLARVWDRRDVPRVYYPVAIAAIAAAGMGAFAVALPQAFDFFLNQAVRIVGYDAGAAQRTVAEAQPLPLEDALGFFYDSYGLALYAAGLGWLLVLWNAVTDDTPRAGAVLALLWAVVLIMATLTQRRFDYYLALPVAGFTAVIAQWAYDLVDVGEVAEDLGDVQVYQVLTVVAVVLVVGAPLAAASDNALATADNRSNPGAVTTWEDSLDWLEENTPEQGAYDQGGNAGRLEFYGTYGQTDDFAYRDGEYGVISWWDYGHWITMLGHRAPVANPFQQGATTAAHFLLATNETTANDLLVSDSGEQTRYVMVDSLLGTAERAYSARGGIRCPSGVVSSAGADGIAVCPSRKYAAPTAFYQRADLSQRDAFFRVYSEQGRLLNVVQTNRSYHTMRVRLFQLHGSAREAGRSGLAPQQTMVTDWRCVTGQESGNQFAIAPSEGQVTRLFNSTQEARQYVATDGADGCEGKLLNNGSSSQLGGYPATPTERISALEHYRLVHVNPQISPTRFREPAVKTFERVEGATVRGQGPADATVSAFVRMRTNTGRNFTYRQFAETGPDGSFTMTLPYSTTGYENWGTAEGYTNVSVRAVGNYTIQTTSPSVDNGTISRFRATTEVSEARVLGEDTSPVQVTLEEQVVAELGGDEGSDGSTGNSTAARAPPA